MIKPRNKVSFIPLLIISVVFSFGFFHNANASVLATIQNTSNRLTALTAQSYTQQISTYPVLEWKMWGNSSSPTNMMSQSIVAVLPRMSATSTSQISINYTIQKTGTQDCYFSIVDVELTPDYPQLYKVTSAPKITHQVTASTTGTVTGTITGAYTAGGALGSAGYQQFGIVTWLESSYNGHCIVTINSVKSGSLELLNAGQTPLSISSSQSSGSGSVDLTDTNSEIRYLTNLLFIIALIIIGHLGLSLSIRMRKN